METDKSADNEKELTSSSSSSMGKLLSTNKEEKSDSNDTLPTSSTDASTSFKATNLVSDDPISSTSSEMDTVKTKQLINDPEKSNFSGLEEVELLEMSMAKPSEKIEENVDDLVNDLETLLGESSKAFNLPAKGVKDTKLKQDESEKDVLNLEKCLPENEVSSNTTNVEKEINLETITLISQCSIASNLKLSEEPSEVDDKTSDSDSLTNKTVNSLNENNTKEMLNTNKVDDKAAEQAVVQTLEFSEKNQTQPQNQNVDDTDHLHINNDVILTENDKEVNDDASHHKDAEQNTNDVTDSDVKQVNKEEIVIENIPNSEVLVDEVGSKPEGENVDETVKASEESVAQLEKNTEDTTDQNTQSVKTDEKENVDATANKEQKEIYTVDKKNADGLVREITEEAPHTVEYVTEVCEKISIEVNKDLGKVICTDENLEENNDIVEKDTEEQINDIAASENVENIQELPSQVCKTVDEGIFKKEENTEIAIKEVGNVQWVIAESSDITNTEENKQNEQNIQSSKDEIQEFDNTVVDKNALVVDKVPEEAQIEKEYIQKSVSENCENINSKGNNNIETLVVQVHVENEDIQKPVSEENLKTDPKGIDNVVRLEEMCQTTSVEDVHQTSGVKEKIDDENVAAGISKKKDINEDIKENVCEISETVAEKVDRSQLLAVQVTETVVEDVDMNQVNKEQEKVDKEVLSSNSTSSDTLISSKIKQIPNIDYTIDKSSMQTKEKEETENMESKSDFTEKLSVSTENENKNSIENAHTEPDDANDQYTFDIEEDNSHDESDSGQKENVKYIAIQKDCTEIQSNLETPDYKNSVQVESGSEVISDQELSQEDTEINDSDKKEDLLVQPTSALKEHTETTLVNIQSDSVNKGASYLDQNAPQEEGMSSKSSKIHLLESTIEVDMPKKNDGQKDVESVVECNIEIVDNVDDKDVYLTTEIDESQSFQSDLESQKAELKSIIDVEQPEEKKVEELGDLPIYESTGTDNTDNEEKTIETTHQMDVNEVTENIVPKCEESEKGQIEPPIEKELSEVHTFVEKDFQEKEESVSEVNMQSDLADVGQSTHVDKGFTDKPECDKPDNIEAVSKEKEVKISKLPEYINLNRDEENKEDSIEAEPVVQEPDDISPDKAKLELMRKDDIVEVSEEQIIKENLLDDISDIPLVKEDTEGTVNKSDLGTVHITEIKSHNDLVNINVAVNKGIINTNIEIVEAEEIVQKEPKAVLSEKSVFDEKKPISEINIRRKTVEQDLEKVVCLSEESSDSDTTEIIKSGAKDKQESVDNDTIKGMPLSDDQVSTSETVSQEQLVHGVPITEESRPNQEETDLIKIAKDVEELQSNDAVQPISEIPSEESMPSISDILSQQSLPKNQEETDRTVLSLSTLQNDNAKSNTGDRNLTDKELREIEAIRAAVASITDSSQDTYDSYLVESSVTVETSLPDVSNDIPELSNDPTDVQEMSGNSQSSFEPILVEETILSSSNTDNTEEKKTECIKESEKASNVTLPDMDNDKQSEGVSPDNVVDTNLEVACVADTSVTITESKPDQITENTAVLKKPNIENKVTDKENITKEAILGSSIDDSEEIDDIEDSTVVNEKTGKNKGRKSTKINEPLSINIEDVEREKVYSPKVTIKPVKVPDDEVSTTSDAEINKGSLKMTITKQSDKMHSILKVFNPEDDSELDVNEEPIPKLIIKPKLEQQHSPKTPSRSSKVYSPTSTQRCGSPRVTIKPLVKPPETKNESVSPLKITFKPVVKADEGTKRHSPKTLKEQDQKNHNPKITIKPIPKPQEPEKEETLPTTPKLTIKPIKRPHDDTDLDVEQERSSPKITIKPVRSSEETDQANQSTPRLIIKAIKKHDDEIKEPEQGRSSPKISIKPLMKPAELEVEEEMEEVKERIVLKINKGNLPTPGKDKNKREYPEDDKSEKLGKIKLKFSTSGGHPHIVQEDEGNKKLKKDNVFSQNPVLKGVEESPAKRVLEEKLPEKNKKLRTSVTPERDNKIEVRSVEAKLNSPVISIDDSSGDTSAGDNNSSISNITKIAEIASRTTHIVSTPVLTVGVVTPVTPAPKKRGRPRKVPLEIRPELTDPVNPHIRPLSTSGSMTPSSQSAANTPDGTSSVGRPKRSCRGQNVIAALGIKPRKPRGRGRGSKVNMGDRMPIIDSSVGSIQTISMKPEKDSKLSKAKIKLMQKAIEERVKRQEQIRIIREEVEGAGVIDKVRKEGCEGSILQGALESRRSEPGNPLKSSSLVDSTVFKHLEVTVTKANLLSRSIVGEDLIDVTLSKRTSVQIDQNETIIILTDDEEDNPGPKTSAQDDETSYDRKFSEEYKLAERISIEMTEGRELEEATEDDDDAGDSEEDRRRELVKQRKQEAIKKCRAKRMEKLAKAAELKKKRQEQAKQQREARIAAEEAEKAAAEKARINRRYGRYGTPKPQISLIDEPVRETGGTVKSPRCLFDPITQSVRISQPGVIVIDEDSNQQVLKQHESSNISMPSTSNQSANPTKYVSDPMQVDLEESSLAGQSDDLMMDEETRMSADFRNSRSQTPAKQSIAPPENMVEDSQGSLGTTESGKSKNAKAPRLEVHQEADGNVFTADQLAEYCWNGQGPFMLQEQVAHFLGIKSFKRKYPHVSRRSVDIQERDFLKENGLASETLCDLGLTAVNAQDILDIMYSDFQEKYEEYCRVQREKQARDFANKQKATQQALKAGHERLDIIEQAVQSAAQWNKQFNKERKEQRKASMDLQNLVVHYPKSKVKPVQTRKIGNYPVALVPGQFTDFYKDFTPTELNNLPLNTMCYNEIKIAVPESESDDSDSSDSDSESSSSSSSSDSECGADCKECNNREIIPGQGGKNIAATKDATTTVGTPA